MQHLDRLELDPTIRAELWHTTIVEIERYIAERDHLPIAPDVSPDTIRANLAELNFMQPLEPLAAICVAVRGLREQQDAHRPSAQLWVVQSHTRHHGHRRRRTRGRVQPTACRMGHSPFAVEVEQHLIRAFADRFGYDAKEAEGTFINGGNEANHTALICALTSTFPQFSRSGLRGLERQPVLYASTEETLHQF